MISDLYTTYWVETTVLIPLARWLASLLVSLTAVVKLSRQLSQAANLNSIGTLDHLGPSLLSKAWVECTKSKNAPGCPFTP